MQNIQNVFNRIQEMKKEQRGLRALYKDALLNSAEYKKTNEQMQELREKKKQIENSIKSEFASETEKIESLKNDLATETELIRDIAFSMMMKGESVEVMDGGENRYEPVFGIKFKRVY